jgi:hypothetical protein
VLFKEYNGGVITYVQKVHIRKGRGIMSWIRQAPKEEINKDKKKEKYSRCHIRDRFGALELGGLDLNEWNVGWMA